MTIKIGSCSLLKAGGAELEGISKGNIVVVAGGAGKIQLLLMVLSIKGTCDHEEKVPWSRYT